MENHFLVRYLRDLESTMLKTPILLSCRVSLATHTSSLNSTPSEMQHISKRTGLTRLSRWHISFPDGLEHQIAAPGMLKKHYLEMISFMLSLRFLDGTLNFSVGWRIR
jgi:hypothetical protein